LATSLIAFGVGLAVVPTASADPNDATQTDTPAPGPGTGPAASVGQPAPGPGTDGPAATVAQASDDPGAPAPTACKQFAAALNYASINYEDFAYSIAGNGASVDYAKPDVQSNNVTGRTALRQAAAAALDASGTPGLQPEVADPMRAWSMSATKLLLVMGVHGNGDMINGAATDMNNNATNVQFACARAGTHA
jgi:hypothetical protein